MMKKSIKAHILLVFIAVFAITSCGEDSGAVEEFTDWQHKNEDYFNKLYSATQERIDRGDATWKIIRNWSLPKDNKNFHAQLSDNIIVRVIEESKSKSGSPLYSDSVKVHYRGRLIPSATYKTGYVFDHSYMGKYNLQTMTPAKFAVKSLVDGFTTALMHMKIGDRWEVYIPYQLGYGEKEQGNGTIPAYSTLIFDIQLAGFYRTKSPAARASIKADEWIER